MLDLRPVGYVIGLLVAALGLTMLGPLLADVVSNNGQWPVFLTASMLTMMLGATVSVACSNGVDGVGMTLRQTFMLTTLVWLALPVFGALPFVIGASQLSITDAMFEAMSGITTTGSTIMPHIDGLPEGLLLWRGILQWLGGIGIIVMAMVFLPELKVGGMQVFRSEGFETMGKILPRAAEIASNISVIYVGLTFACAVTYILAGMPAFDAVVHAMTTIATGGFANTDRSFMDYGPFAQYAATVFMFLAALPFVRYVQMLGGSARPLFCDSQVRVFLLLILGCSAAMVMSLAAVFGVTEPVVRLVMFNVVSIMSGTGYAAADYMQWSAFAVMMFFFIGLIGGCAGSTACSVKIFRYQILFASIRAQIRQIHSPHGVFQPRYDGRTVSDDVLNSVMAFFVVFIVSVGVVSVALSMTGLDFITSVSGAATALANIGPGLGTEIGPAGNFAGLNDPAKWILTVAMFVGRLEMMAVLVLVTRNFWRD